MAIPLHDGLSRPPDIRSAMSYPFYDTTGQVRAFAHTFREAAPKGGFGVWWLCPPIPALAGNACRWAVVLQNFIFSTKD